MLGTLLAIDDNPDNLVLIGAALEPDYDVRVATSGEAGLALAEECWPDLILLDVMMPGLDGFETLRRLQRNETLKDIPVLFLTSLNRQEDEARCFEVGGVDFISKPFSPVVLRARVASQLRLKQQADQLRELALKDGLTGLFNRRYFDEIFEREWRACQRQHQPLSVLLMDVDHFKLYNDTYGHQAGDECLRTVARAIRGQLRRGRDFVARYGGEEFICLLPETGADEAARVGEKVRAAVEALAVTHAASSTGGPVTLSIGVAAASVLEGTTPEALLEQADANLYRAKASGRNRVCGGTG